MQTVQLVTKNALVIHRDIVWNRVATYPWFQIRQRNFQKQDSRIN